MILLARLWLIRIIPVAILQSCVSLSLLQTGKVLVAMLKLNTSPPTCRQDVWGGEEERTCFLPEIVMFIYFISQSF